MTSTQTHERKASQIFTIAAGALLDHIQTHGLEFPAEIVTDFAGGVPTLRLIVRDGDHHAWLASIHVDDLRTVAASEDNQGNPRRWSEWTVRLPETGIRFELCCLRPVVTRTAAA